MKKYYLIIISLLLVLTGCGNSSEIVKDDYTKVESVSKVLCTLTSSEENVTMNQIVTLKFDSDNLSLAKIEIDAILADNYQKYIKEFVQTLEQQFEGYDSYGVSVNITETSKGAKVSYLMDKDAFSDFYDSKIDRNEIVSMFEELGYSCN